MVDSTSSSRPRFAEEVDRRAHLWLVLPPVLVFILAEGLFEFCVHSGPQLDEVVQSMAASAPVPSDARTLLVGRGQYLWLAAALWYMVVSVCASGWSGWILLYQASTRTVRWQGCGLALGLVIVGLVGLIFAQAGAWNDGVFGFTYRALEAYSGGYGSGFLRGVWATVTAVNAMAVVAPVLVVVAAGIVAAPQPHQSDQAQAMVRQAHHLRQFLNFASLVLVTGILHMAAWMHWPAAMIEDEQAANAIRQLAQGVTLYWGGAFSLVLATTYLPIALLLQRRAWAALQGRTDVDAPQYWMTERGLAISPIQHLQRAVVILAPLIAALLDQFLGNG